jgi:large subunit ribosomal protein L2
VALKYYKPITSSQRQKVLVDRSELWNGKPVKSLTRGLISSGGRNNLGRITVRHRGGGHKRSYRLIDFKRIRDGEDATVERIEYDPNRTSFIALIRYQSGDFSYIIAPQKLNKGALISSGKGSDIRVGNTLELKDIPVGTVVHNVEMKPGKGAQIARSAGTSVQILGRDSGYIQLRLSSGEIRMVKGECRATVGVVSNPDQKNISLSKAGRNRWLGKRPTVRGVAMNPIDHPHGGGEGKTSGGRHPVTPWGKPTKGHKTRSKKKMTDSLIIRRRRKK